VNTGNLATVSEFPASASLAKDNFVSDSPSEPEAFTRLYQSTVAPLRRYLSRLLGNSGEAEEVAHDAYARIYRKSADKPEALLYTTARRLAINRLKRREISPVAPTDFGINTTATSAPSVPDQVIARQEWSLLQTAINDLPPGCRQVLLLRKVELLSHRKNLRAPKQRIQEQLPRLCQRGIQCRRATQRRLARPNLFAVD